MGAASRSGTRQAAVPLAVSRLAFGVGALVAPDRVVRAVVGGAPSRRALTVGRVLLAARDVAVGVGTIRAVDGDVVPFLRAGAACDALDAAAVVTAWRVLPTVGRRAVLVAALVGLVSHLAVADRLGGDRWASGEPGSRSARERLGPLADGR